MQKAAGEYVSNTVKLNKEGYLLIPELLAWYAEDFTESIPGRHNLILGLASHLGKNLQQELQKIEYLYIFNIRNANSMRCVDYIWGFAFKVSSHT